MVVNGEQNIGTKVTYLEIVWRNPATLVGAHLKAKEASSPYYHWAEQARKIHARRANWNVNHRWVA